METKNKKNGNETETDKFEMETDKFQMETDKFEMETDKFGYFHFVSVVFPLQDRGNVDWVEVGLLLGCSSLRDWTDDDISDGLTEDWCSYTWRNQTGRPSRPIAVGRRLCSSVLGLSFCSLRLQATVCNPIDNFGDGDCSPTVQYFHDIDQFISRFW